MDPLVHLLRTRADADADRTRLVYLLDGECEEQPWSAGALDRQARAVAATLQQHAAPGERALLVFGPGMEAVVAFFGALYAGLVPVPLEPPRPGQPLDGLPRWHPLPTGPFVTGGAPGSPDTMTKPPYAAELARKIQHHLGNPSPGRRPGSAR